MSVGSDLLNRSKRSCPTFTTCSSDLSEGATAGRFELVPIRGSELFDATISMSDPLEQVIFHAILAQVTESLMQFLGD